LLALYHLFIGRHCNGVIKQEDLLAAGLCADGSRQPAALLALLLPQNTYESIEC